jgi:hypothetical protein
MKRFDRFLCFCALFFIVFQGCGFFSEPEPFGELQINIRFAGDEATLLSKANAHSSPQAVDRIIVVIREYRDSQIDAPLTDREVVRKEFPLGNDRRLKTTIQVPLQNAGVNYFILEIRAFQGVALLYSGQDFLAFDEERRRLTANIQLAPVAFSLFVSPNSGARLVTVSGVAQDTAVTEFEIVADSVRVRVPMQETRSFSNPMMLFGDNTLVRVIAYRRGESFVEASRQVTYTGLKSDILVVLVWDRPVDLNLELLNPRQRPISVLDLGDDIDGRLLRSDENGYGPEVFEWRANSTLTGGEFAVSVSRPRTTFGQPISGRVYYLLGERINSLSRKVYPFTFGPQELQKTFDNIVFP